MAKERCDLKERSIKERIIETVMIFRETEGAPKKRLAPKSDLVIEREEVGEER